MRRSRPAARTVVPFLGLAGLHGAPRPIIPLTRHGRRHARTRFLLQVPQRGDRLAAAADRVERQRHDVRVLLQ